MARYSSGIDQEFNTSTAIEGAGSSPKELYLGSVAWLSDYYVLNEMLCEFDAAMVTDFKNHSALAGKAIKRGNMEQYSLIELSDMHLVYGAANESGRRAARIYAQRFPQRRHAAHTMFQRLDQRLRETGSLRANMSETGRPRSVTPDVEEVILGVALRLNLISCK
ncbi:hypothetical protein C0J52_16176 [Blattella germanica]|nr:hypothetical protein C0J52_16176 [Blattella germanica]